MIKPKVAAGPQISFHLKSREDLKDSLSLEKEFIKRPLVITDMFYNIMNYTPSEIILNTDQVEQEVKMLLRKNIDTVNQAMGMKALKRPPYYDLSRYNRLEDLIAERPHFQGAAFKYLLRAGHKPEEPVLKDLIKARECLDIEIERLEKLGD